MMARALIQFGDQASLLLWTAFLQFSLVGLVLLMPVVIMGRRPAARHFLALAALGFALVSPITAGLSRGLHLAWTPVPTALRAAASSSANETTGERDPIRLTPQSHRTEFPIPSAQDPVASPGDPRDVAPAEHKQASSHVNDGPGELATLSVPDLSWSASTQSRPPTNPAQENEVPKGPARGAGERPSPARPAKAAAPTLSIVLVRAGFLIWLAGAAAAVANLAWARFRLSRLLGGASVVANPRVATQLERITAALRLATAPELLASSSVANPFVTGVFRARIVLPDYLLLPENEASLVPVLVHECSHVVRRDLWFGWIAQTARAVLWPNPLVHAHGAILARAREELCDNHVLATTSPAAYARALLVLSERLAGLSGEARTAIALFEPGPSLATRVARLLDPRADRSVHLRRGHKMMLAALAVVSVVGFAGVGPETAGGRPTEDRPIAAPEPAPDDKPQAVNEILRQLSARSSAWLLPPANVETLEYDLVVRSSKTPVKVRRGEKQSIRAWTGATLHAGFHELAAAPQRFNVAVKHEAGGKEITLTARLKDPKASFRVVGANGGHPASETTIVVDAEKLVPLEEQTNATTVRYSEWRQVGDRLWIPGQIDVLAPWGHHRMHFEWLANGVWLLHYSESVEPDRTAILTRTQNVRVDHKEAAAPDSDSQRRARERARELVDMLDHNRPWLDPGPTGAGWRPGFRTLAYDFHTEREDAREACVLDRNGEVVFEVVADGNGKMKEQLGERRIALNTAETATARRGARFAHLYGRSDRHDGQPYDLALKQYARIGCQLDLPIFQYRQLLDVAAINVEDGDWNGQRCRVATVSNLGRDALLGYGTMLAFTSWSYVHHIYPDKERLYIDAVRKVPLHETLESVRDHRVFEIDFGDYVEAEPGQWAPRSIRIESKDYFTCEYRFKLVAGTHWMLDELVSWFKPNEKSRGVIENVRLDRGEELRDDARRQVDATRKLFGQAGEPDRRINVATAPFVLGEAMRSGPYQIKVSIDGTHNVAVSASSNDAAAADVVPVVFLDDEQRLVFAAPIKLMAQNEGRRGSVSMRGAWAWRTVRSVALPGERPRSTRVSMPAMRFRWGETIAVNIPGFRQDQPRATRAGQPREVRTRGSQMRIDRKDDGSGRLILDLVSIDGPREFLVDVAALLVSEAGDVAACGQLSTKLRVVSEPVEQRLEIDLGKLRPGTDPKYVAVAITPGEVISAPMGSRWGTYIQREAPFETTSLLASPDEGAWRIALSSLEAPDLALRLREEFLDNPRHGLPVDEEQGARLSLLKPHADALKRIVKVAHSSDVRRAAARLLAYSEADGAAEALEPLLDDHDPEVRDAAVVGQTFLGRPGHLERIQSILARTPPAGDAARSFHRLEQDALLALKQNRSDAAVDLLGETMLRDLKSLRVVPNAQGNPGIEGPAEQASTLAALLGKTGNARALKWLYTADEVLAGKPEVDAQFNSMPLVHAVLDFKKSAKERIQTELTRGRHPAEWAYAVMHDDDAGFVRAICAMLRRDNLPAGAARYGVSYLRGVDSPESLVGLRDAYERRLVRDENEPRYWLELCDALAARRDSRGLGDAYGVLVDLERPANPPGDDRRRFLWENARDDLRRQAESVFAHAPTDLRAEFLRAKAGAASPAERRAVLRLLWTLSELPQPLAAAVSEWAKDTDAPTAELARRLLDRS